jgi:hypothetical protein
MVTMIAELVCVISLLDELNAGYALEILLGSTMAQKHIITGSLYALQSHAFAELIEIRAGLLRGAA